MPCPSCGNDIVFDPQSPRERTQALTLARGNAYKSNGKDNPAHCRGYGINRAFGRCLAGRGRPVGRPCSGRGYSQYSPVWAYSLRIYDAIVWQCVLAQIALRLVLSAQAALPPLVQHGFGAGRGRVVVLASASDLIFISDGRPIKVLQFRPASQAQGLFSGFRPHRPLSASSGRRRISLGPSSYRVCARPPRAAT